MAQERLDSLVRELQREADYTSRVQTGLDELVALIREIKTACKGHRDSACSAQVLSLIKAYHEALSKRVERAPPAVRKDPLREVLDATRKARIDAAKAKNREDAVNAGVSLRGMQVDE